MRGKTLVSPFIRASKSFGTGELKYMNALQQGEKRKSMDSLPQRR